MKARDIAFVSVCAALSVVILYAACVMPTGRLALGAVASCLPALVVVRSGKKAALLHFAAVSALSFLLLPNKAWALSYGLFLGHYAIFKSLFEKLDKRYLEWIFKILLFNACAAGIYGLWRLFFTGSLPYGPLWLFAGGNIVFIIYDVALTILIDFIIKRTKYFRGSR